MICSETGFPSAGASVWFAKPLPEHTARYFNEIYAFSRTHDLEVCFFEAVDEPWKARDTGIEAESYFGLLDTDLQPKGTLRKSLEAIAQDRLAE